MDEPKHPWDCDDDMLVGLEEVGDDDLDEGDLEAIADIEAGRVISHEAVMRWLDDLSNGIRRPRPQPGE